MDNKKEKKGKTHRSYLSQQEVGHGELTALITLSEVEF